MKNLIIFAVFAMLASTTSTFASISEPTFELNRGDLRLAPIAGKVVRVSPLCPDHMTCFVDGTVIDLEFTVGCLDRVTPVTFDAIEKDGDLNVYVSVQAIYNEGSRLVRCAKPNRIQQQVTLFDKYGNVKVRFLGAQQD